MSSVASAIPNAAVALIVANALGVFRSKKIVGSGIMGELGGDSIQSYDLQRRGGTLFSGPSYSIQNVRDNAEYQYVQDAYKQLRTATSNMADVLGVGSDAIKNFTTKLGTEIIHQEVGKTGIKFDGLKPEEIAKKIEDALLSANEEMAKFVLGATDFGKQGETASQTLQRLAGSLTTVNQIFGNLGFELMDASLAGGDAASKFADLFGGMDRLVQDTSSYYDNFYSEAERSANSTKQLTEELQKLGVEGLPGTREGFRKLVDDAFGAGNEELGASLIKLSPLFAQLTQETGNLGKVAKASAEQIAAEAANLNTRLLQVQGDTAALRKQEIDALDESNRALLEHIFALEDKKQADAEAAALAEQIASETASLNQRLMQAQGDTIGLRKLEVESVNAANRALIEQIQAQERYNEIHAESEGLVTRLLQTQGDTAALRERELSVLHDSNQVLLKHIFRLEDQAKATELLGRLTGDFAQYGLSELEKKIEDIDKVAEDSINSLEEWGQASYDNILVVERWADASRKAAIAADALANAQSSFDDLGKAVDLEKSALEAAFNEVQAALQAEINKFASELSAVKGLFSRSISAERESLTSAANEQKSALQKQIDALNGVSDASEKAASNLKSVIDALQGAIKNLRGLDVLERSNYAQAVGQIDSILANAKQGIIPDASALQDPLSVITSNNSDSYSSSFDFNRDQLVQAAKLEELAAIAGKQLGFEDQVLENDKKQLQALQDQIKLVDDQLQADLKSLDEISKWGEAQFNALEGIDASIVTMDEAQKAVAELTAKYQDDQIKKIEEQMKQAEDEHKKSINSLNMIYQAGLMQINALQGINATLGSANYHLGILSDAVKKAEAAQKDAEKSAKDVPKFASGGFHIGGFRIVGEDGPEIEATGPARYWNASKTKEMLKGDTSPQEVRYLREDNRAQASALVAINARLTKLMERWDRDGMPAVRVEDA
jgi:tetrahydromethanopterin S-methyltransferase subunit B